MNKVAKTSVTRAIEKLVYLPDRKPEMAFTGGAEKAFAELARFNDGGIFAGHYSGNSEWERHPKGDEIVMALGGSATMVLLVDAKEVRLRLNAMELIVVPRNTWHRFEGSKDLKVLTATPQPTDHRLDPPRAAQGS